MHFRRIIRPWTDVSLGNCQYLDSCRSMATCRHVHYEREPQPDTMTPEVAHMMAMRQQVPAYLQVG
jgi:mRNA (2'-O-methyladenosine-N6-)-methyltransferase